jgi:hypothetical protein
MTEAAERVLEEARGAGLADADLAALVLLFRR